MIDVLTQKDGRARIEVRGAKGTSCLDLTRDVEAALGGQVESREMTTEAQESAVEQVQDWLVQRQCGLPHGGSPGAVTAVTTLRQQKRDVLGCLTEACAAAIQAKPAPSFPPDQTVVSQG